jgi:hypothetical protein
MVVLVSHHTTPYHTITLNHHNQPSSSRSHHQPPSSSTTIILNHHYQPPYSTIIINHHNQPPHHNDNANFLIFSERSVVHEVHLVVFQSSFAHVVHRLRAIPSSEHPGGGRDVLQHGDWCDLLRNIYCVLYRHNTTDRLISKTVL